MSKHKKQHFVPSSYLKAWCDPQCPPKYSPYVWRFSFDGTESRKKSPDNIFHETDMYTIHRKNGERDLRLEHGLQQLETKFARIRRKILQRHRELSPDERFWVCVFIAAIHSRTKATRDHWKKNWKRPLEKMENLIEWEKTATHEEKKRMALFSCSPISSPKETLSYEQIKELYENPLQRMMPSMIDVLAPRLYHLNMAIFCTSNSPGYITSDYPCVWFDPEAYKRPPFYRAPALVYPTLEITFPISPSQCIVLSRHDYIGYINSPENIVNEFNRRTRFYANEYFVVNSNTKNTFWFDPGDEPTDSWEKKKQ